MQSCPQNWTNCTANGVRVRGRPDGSYQECHSTFYRADHSYTRVCGQVIGYQFGYPDSFYSSFEGIDEPYMLME